jgi:DNA gyrase/topoisomerase IV subunit A
VGDRYEDLEDEIADMQKICCLKNKEIERLKKELAERDAYAIGKERRDEIESSSILIDIQKRCGAVNP